MSRINQSFCYGLFQGDLSLDDLCREAAAMGYPAVELWDWRSSPFEELAAAARRYGLRIVSLIGHRSLTDGLNKWENHDRIEAEIRESVELCQKYDVPGMIVFSGNRLEGVSEEEQLAAIVAGLNRAKGAAEAARVNLNLELLNSKINHAGYLCDRTAFGVEVVRRVASPNVKLLYDIYHMQIMEGDLIRTIRENIQHIGHFHTAGNPDRRDLDEEQEICYAAVMRAIRDTGYSLYVGHEFSPKGDKLAALKHA
ncbi:MAG: TIM barrel protein, partial [Armatimonadetes bacterium]|nr:TIM barrel protein [Armatimonadota bacterium]